MAIDYDRFWHCVVTGERLYVDRVIDGKLQRVPTPNLTHMSFLLKDGSVMRVCISKEAKEAFNNTKEERDNIMARVYKGWEVETIDLVADKSKPQWTLESREAYLKNQAEIEIIGKMDDLPDASLPHVEREIARIKADLLKEEVKDVRSAK